MYFLCTKSSQPHWWILSSPARGDRKRKQRGGAASASPSTHPLPVSYPASVAPLSPDLALPLPSLATLPLPLSTPSLSSFLLILVFPFLSQRVFLSLSPSLCVSLLSVSLCFNSHLFLPPSSVCVCLSPHHHQHPIEAITKFLPCGLRKKEFWRTRII